MTHLLFTENIIKISPAMAESTRFPQPAGNTEAAGICFAAPS